MWRSPTLSFLLRTLLRGPGKPSGFRWAGHPLRPWAHLSSLTASPSPSPSSVALAGGAPDRGSRAGGGGGGAESGGDFMTLSEAKKLMRLVNVEALKRKLGVEGEEVIGYAELLEACEGTGVARSREEASALAWPSTRPVWSSFSGARSISTPIRNWSGRIEHGAGHSCSNYSTRASSVKSRHSVHYGIMQDQAGSRHGSKTMMLSEQDNQEVDQSTRSQCKRRVGENISAVDKRKFLINTLFDLKDSKEAVYGTLDAWAAWEHNFPLVALKRALLVLEKEQQWHRVVQVIKWILSKGQGTTTGTYEQLIRALEKDNRAEEAHKIWVKKIGHDLHSVPWRVCDFMISIYYRNNMLERLVKLFKGLESYDRRPPTKAIVQKVADAYEMRGLLEEKTRVMEKYSILFSESPERFKKSRKVSPKNEKKAGKIKNAVIVASDTGPVDSGPSDEEIDSTA